MLAAADAGADDVVNDGESFQVLCSIDAFGAVRDAVEAGGFSIDSAELTMVPKLTVDVTDEGVAKKLMKLMDALDDNDDVQDVYANFDIPEAILEALEA
jgi:transcriptional/translational regulatory protein YebC/TACO1